MGAHNNHYCLEEAQRNVAKSRAQGVHDLSGTLVPKLVFVPTELSFDKVLVFPKAKDRPVLLSAWS